MLQTMIGMIDIPNDDVEVLHLSPTALLTYHLFQICVNQNHQQDMDEHVLYRLPCYFQHFNDLLS